MQTYGAVARETAELELPPTRSQHRSPVIIFGLATALFVTSAIVSVNTLGRGPADSSSEMSIYEPTGCAKRDMQIIGPYNQTKIASDYPWSANYTGLVEPFQVTKLKIDYTDLDATIPSSMITWKLHIESSDEMQTIGYGVAIDFIFTSLGAQRILVVNPGKGALCHVERRVIVKYVRREIRMLSDEHRTLFFDTMEVLWNTSSSIGQKKYGGDYRSIVDITTFHAQLAGAKYCDHIHDGMGFMTMHMAMGIQLEQSLQSVAPAATLPYWDFTIDEAKLQSGEWSTYDESPMWDPEWFGERDGGDNHMISKGRWAYLPITAEAWNLTHNSYGFLRAPWNNNNRLGVTRSASQCGYSNEKLPNCESHYSALVDFNTWEDFAWNLPYEPHGNVHIVIGGNVDCSPTFDKIEEYLKTKVENATIVHEKVNSLRSTAFALVKEAYRRDVLAMPEYCSLDTPYSECHGTCIGYEDVVNATDNIDTRQSIFKLVTSLGIFDAIKELCVNGFDTSHCLEIQREVLAVLCKEGIAVSGDQLEAGSPADPSFWPVHPTIERLWNWKKITGSFSDETWPTTNTALEANCTGHAANDYVPFAFAMAQFDQQKIYTNLEIYNFADPVQGLAPYVYDHFDWDHCSEMGFDFRKIRDQARV